VVVLVLPLPPRRGRDRPLRRPGRITPTARA